MFVASALEWMLDAREALHAPMLDEVVEYVASADCGVKARGINVTANSIRKNILSPDPKERRGGGRASPGGG